MLSKDIFASVPGRNIVWGYSCPFSCFLSTTNFSFCGPV